MKLLIVEDDQPMVKILSNVLENESFEVLIAKNGQLGLEMALAERPDLILIDILMPVMDGMELLAALRADAWGKTVKVIMLTNLTDVQKMNESIQYNVSAYLVKSNSQLTDIVETVKSVLTGVKMN